MMVTLLSLTSLAQAAGSADNLEADVKERAPQGRLSPIDDVVRHLEADGERLSSPDPVLPYRFIDVRSWKDPKPATDGTAEEPFAILDAATVTAASAHPDILVFFEGPSTINALGAPVTPTNQQFWYGPRTNITLSDANDLISIQK